MSGFVCWNLWKPRNSDDEQVVRGSIRVKSHRMALEYNEAIENSIRQRATADFDPVAVINANCVNSLNIVHISWWHATPTRA
ncbi:hypothetical protein V6N13_087863 [Hibiscus sabdariffa]